MTTSQSPLANSTHDLSASPRSSSESRSLLSNKKDDDETKSQDALSLRVKCNSPGVNPVSNPTGNYDVITSQNDSVRILKNAVKNAIGQNAKGRYLRVIASGRLLAPDNAPLSDFKIQDGDCLHAVLAAAGVRGGQQAAMARGTEGTSRRTLRGVGISPSGLILPPPSEDSDSDLEAGAERVGFDRLRSTLTRDEIGAIRLYFSHQVDRFTEQQSELRQLRQHSERSSSETPSNTNAESNNRNNTEDEDDVEVSRLQRLRMEDEWMETQGPTSEFRLNLNTNNPLLMNRALFFEAAADRRGMRALGASGYAGTDRDFIWGFILGFFVGFIMLFWVWMPTVPHKQKMGILTGISFQLVINVVRTAGTSGAKDMV